MEISPELQEKLDQFARLPKQIRAGLIAAVAVVLTAVYYFLVYQGTHAELTSLQARELQLQRKLSEVRSVAANIGAFEEEIRELEQRLTRALRQLPNERELEVLLTDISNLAKSSGVEIKSFERNNEVRHDFYAEVPIELALAGSYHDIARFFDRLARLPRIVNMGRLEMKVGAESTDETRLAVVGTATTFRFVGDGA